MNNLEKGICCSLQKIKGIGNRTLWKIKKHYKSFQSFYEANYHELLAFLRDPALVEAVISQRKKNNPLKLLEYFLEKGIRITSVEDSNYPFLLANIYDPPYLLYYQGDIKIAEKLCVAIVGSRSASPYGKTQAFRLAADLSAHDVTVVSGLARGIDTQAHLGALDKGGKTIAVLGSGLDIIYPRENLRLSEQIKREGLLISEFSPGTHPEPFNFPIRNRTISGLSRGVIIVEAGLKSGALITADYALEQGRDVFALPGPVNSQQSAGTNRLIKQGAQLVTSAQDILEEYSLELKENSKILEPIPLNLLDSYEKKILECLQCENLHRDELLRRTGYDFGMLSSLLLQLELKGFIKAIAGNYYMLNK